MNLTARCVELGRGPKGWIGVRVVISWVGLGLFINLPQPVPLVERTCRMLEVILIIIIFVGSHVDKRALALSV